MNTPFTRILELHRLAIEQVSEFPKKRRIFSQLQNRTPSRHFVGIIGPRGVGKSVLLRQLCRECGDQGLYISLDAFEEIDVFEITKRAVQDYKVTHLFLDEVHFVNSIDKDLKKIYDFLDVHLTFTSSVSVAMHQSSRDLSRRVELINLRAFSYGEFLEFSDENLRLPPLTLEALCQQSWQPSHLRAGSKFYDYLKGGVMPYSLQEREILPLQKNILNKILEKDLPSIHPLTAEDIVICKKMVEFIGKSNVDGISYSNLSKNLGITKYKAEIYVDLLEKAFVLHRVMPMGTNVLKEPKILMSLPYRQLYCDFDMCIGGTREDFVMDCLAMAGKSVHYLKSTRGQKTPDFWIDDQDKPLVLEVGGKGKGRAQFKGVKVDRKLILADGDSIAPNKIPLFLLGFLQA